MSEGEDLKPLRVAFVSALPPDRGNLAEYGAYLSRSISQCKEVERVDVLANRVPGAARDEVLGAKLAVHRVWKLGSAWSLFWLVACIVKLRPDVVHLNAGIRTWGVGRLVNLVGAALPLILRLFGLRVVTTLHTIGETVRLDQMGIGLFTRWGLKLASWLYLRSSLVTVTLRSMQRALQESFNARNVAHVSHGTYGQRVAAAPVVDVPRVLTFGFWGAFKDADLMVNAVQKVREQGVPAELVFGGGPHPYFPEIYHQTVARYRHLEWVRFTGYVPEEQIGALFTSSSVVAMPYRTNAGASGVLNLCRSYGRPVLISKEPALLEQVRYEGGSALVFGDASELTQKLRELLTDGEAQKRLGESNLEVARQLTIDTQALKLVHLFRDAQFDRELATASPMSEPEVAAHIG